MFSFGRYTLVRPIGRGGMAEIWRARLTGPGGFVKHVALKMILPDIADDAMFAEMFGDEAKLAASLVHPNLIQVFDFGEVDGRLFLAMEYVAGASFDRLLGRLAKAGEALPAPLALYVALEACRGLGYVHDRGIVHRDVSPQNLIVSSDGDVKVGDFGIAKAASALPRTAAGHVRGKLAYMSPEQLAHAELDGRADLFALGVVLYEALTGRRLFAAKSGDEQSDRIARFDPRAELDAGALPDELRGLVVGMLEPDRARRVASARELEAQLAGHVGVTQPHRDALGALVRRLFHDALEADACDDVASDDAPPVAPLVTQSEPTRIDGAPPPPPPPSTPTLAGELATPPAGPPRRRARRGTPRRYLAAAAAAVILAGGGATAWHALHARPHAGARHGGTLRLAVDADAEPFDVFSVEESRNRRAMGLVIETFLHLGSDGDLDPWVIDHDEERDGGKTIVLHLRPGVWFHDHPCLPGGRGRIATGEDVAYSIRQAQRFGGGIPLAIHAIDVQPDGVRISLDAPAPFYRQQIAFISLLPHELDGCEDLRRMKRPVGTGPFRFAAEPDGVVLDLVRAPHYWRRGPDGQALPYLDEVEVLPVDDLASVLGRMHAGDLEMTWVAPADFGKVLDLSATPVKLAPALAGLQLDVATWISRSTVGLFGVFVTKAPGPLADRRVRRALALALDRAALVAESASERPLRIANGRLLGPRMAGYDPSLQPLGHDPAAARALLAPLGPLPAITLGEASRPKLAAAIAAQARAVGLDVRVVPVSPTHLAGALEDGSVDALLATYTTQLYAGESVDLLANLDRDADPDVGKLLLQLAATPDRADRAPIYHAAERALLDDLPVIPIAWDDGVRPSSAEVVRRDVRGYYDPVTGTTPGRGDLALAWLAR